MHRIFSLGSLFLVACSNNETYEEKISRYHRLSAQEIIKEIHKPEEVKWYIQNYLRKDADIYSAYTFRDIHERRKGDCSEAVVAAAALLSDDGYPPNVIIFRKPFDPNLEKHAIFVYQENQRWGSLGINRVDNITPSFSVIEELAEVFPYREYAFLRLPVEKFPNWILGSENLMKRRKFFGVMPKFENIER